MKANKGKTVLHYAPAQILSRKFQNLKQKSSKCIRVRTHYQIENEAFAAEIMKFGLNNMLTNVKRGVNYIKMRHLKSRLFVLFHIIPVFPKTEKYLKLQIQSLILRYLLVHVLHNIRYEIKSRI